MEIYPNITIILSSAMIAQLIRTARPVTAAVAIVPPPQPLDPIPRKFHLTFHEYDMYACKLYIHFIFIIFYRQIKVILILTLHSTLFLCLSAATVVFATIQSSQARLRWVIQTIPVSCVIGRQ